MQTRKLYGLIGKDISYSFSRGYFSEKFQKLGLSSSHHYTNFDLKTIEEFSGIPGSENGKLSGMNVTIPYKEDVMEYLDEINDEAKEIGAVNTIKILPDGKKIGYNTDVYGFDQSIAPFLKSHHTHALILGTGGASKAVAYAFKKRNIDYKFVSRTQKHDQLTYEDITNELLATYTVVVNCTPLGTSPKTELHPSIPFEALTEKHLLFDLIYNPAETTFLKLGRENGAKTANGMKMLELQAEKSWEIWNR